MIHKLSRATIKLLFLYSLLAFFHDLALADPPYQLCSNASDNKAYTTSFQNNLNDLFISIVSNASVAKFYNTFIGNDSYRVYGLYMCLNFISNEDCQSCIADASQDIVNLCPNKTEAVVWEEYCQLRYSNEDFFGQLDVTGNILLDNVLNISEPERYRSVVNNTLSILTTSAAFNASTNKYETGEEVFADMERQHTVSALVQCTLDLSDDDCNTCLQIAIRNITSCCYFSRGARVLSRSCYLRYELYGFYEGATSEPPALAGDRGSGIRRKTLIIIIVTTALVVLLLLALLAFTIYCFATRGGIWKRSRRRTEQDQSPNCGDIEHTDLHHQYTQGMDDLTAKDFYIDLKTIRAATNNFSDSNVLGQGGFGPVYKGILGDGKEVAVKKLSSCSDQGTEEFINEVLLILKLQHRNLVRLLGFCVDGEEKILIYEFMPNSSLDAILFDPEKSAQLSWSKRLDIVNGIAKGLLYLHEDSYLRIVHRDLKPSNVLLDSSFNPKISDFGMARIITGCLGETNTATIVGTCGYMAPEYAMQGLYSIKSDVYSFGVVLLEIITGRSNAGFHKSKRAPSLTAYAWKLWNEGNALELMDPALIDACSSDEFLRHMNIGLLCIQEDAFDRPTMSSVVVMLNGKTATLKQPQRPPFSVGRFTKHNEENPNQCSTNNVTMSDILPR